MKLELPESFSYRRVLLLALIVVGLYLVISLLPTLPARTGKVDFTAYWSASHLLAKRANFSDEATLLAVQTEKAGWNETYAMKTWNPPWVLVWLLPYGILGFERAAFLWIISNVGFLFTSVVLTWRFYIAGASEQKLPWAALAAAILFPSTLVALIFGQMNILVLFALVLFFYLLHRGKHGVAGVALSFTMVKPHIVYLTLAIILFHLLRRRNWRALTGFALSLLLPLLVVYALRPTFPAEYAASLGEGQLLGWETPTLATFLALILGWNWFRLIGILILPLVLLLWWIREGDLLEWTEVTLFLSLLTAPFAWSYDFVVLLIPLTHLIYWLCHGYLPRRESILITFLLVALYGVYYVQRVATPSELYFFWVPVTLAGLFAWGLYRSRPSAQSTYRVIRT